MKLTKYKNTEDYTSLVVNDIRRQFYEGDKNFPNCLDAYLMFLDLEDTKINMIFDIGGQMPN